MSINNSVAVDQSSSDYDLEFLNISDDAWYSVRTVLVGEKLTVKYLNFGDETDNVFEPHNFKSVKELAVFTNRFRPVSHQLQDHECKKLMKGTMVCASHSFDGIDNRFYDAKVEDVIYKKHSIANGEEECLCTFLIFWQHGPDAGYLTTKKIENICLVQSRKQLDRNVACFLEIAKGKLKGASLRPLPKHDVPSCTDGTRQEKIASSPKTPKSIFIPRYFQKAKCARRSSVNAQPFEERIAEHNESIGEESDMGGDDKQYVVLIDNLDKDLTSSTIVEFIHRHTSLLAQAYVFPSLSTETYTRGALLLGSEKDLDKLCQFLDSPNYIIMSCGGRPLVVSEKLSEHETFTLPDGTLMLNQHRSVSTSNGLKVVHSGSEEYRKGKQLLTMFLEFVEHQQRLFKRLDMLEREIFQPTPGV